MSVTRWEPFRDFVTLRQAMDHLFEDAMVSPARTWDPSGQRGGHLPLDIRIREETDSGKPTVVAEPESRIADIYRGIARRIAVKIAEKAKDMSAKFPSIVIQNT